MIYIDPDCNHSQSVTDQAMGGGAVLFISYTTVIGIHISSLQWWPKYLLNFIQEILLLRGPTPFEDMIFYLWTDSNEIWTAYVKLNSKHILFMRIF